MVINYDKWREFLKICFLLFNNLMWTLIKCNDYKLMLSIFIIQKLSYLKINFKWIIITTNHQICDIYVLNITYVYIHICIYLCIRHDQIHFKLSMLN